MTANIETRLAPRQRLARGLKYSTVGPVDVTRGVVGISANTVSAAAAGLRKRYESGKLRRQLAAAAQTVAALPEVLQEAAAAPQAKPRRRRRLLLAGAAAATLAGGALAFSIVRRSTRPEPSPLPPSVEVSPKP
ncbi:cell wall synthesis protein CwsA [Mycolicibacterium farcinogenes]|uniref:Cell wall synthesis protein CwsA n=1 Tax=Mycolicibacterium farcinogenes TaxID=1802 RepID=A0ACD1FH23_MYCFR|nr:cell wall synthesis protein CwsA [Mycolicibacterium farcinogenes]QZH66362.1 cell wall synthesis protein CwsA [Mycolicibacterium farcinogenes]